MTFGQWLWNSLTVSVRELVVSNSGGDFTQPPEKGQRPGFFFWWPSYNSMLKMVATCLQFISDFFDSDNKDNK